MEPVPTSIAEGPDGSLYVGQLTGFPFPVGGARVYRVPAGGGTPTIVAEGFTNIIDIALGPDGAAYVLEHDANSLPAPATSAGSPESGRSACAPSWRPDCSSRPARSSSAPTTRST